MFWMRLSHSGLWRALPLYHLSISALYIVSLSNSCYKHDSQGLLELFLQHSLVSVTHERDGSFLLSSVQRFQLASCDMAYVQKPSPNCWQPFSPVIHLITTSKHIHHWWFLVALPWGPWLLMIRVGLYVSGIFSISPPDWPSPSPQRCHA